MTREIAAVDEITETEALKKIETQLAKSPRRASKAEAVEAEDGDEDLQEEAA
jgi:CarD family transcriptional regulator